MTGKLICSLITLAWLATMYGLMRDEVAPAIRHACEIAQSASYAQLDKLVPESRVDQMGMYVGAKHIGKSTRWLKRVDDGLIIESLVEINLKEVPVLSVAWGVIGKDMDAEVTIHFRASVIDGCLQRFHGTVRSSRSLHRIASVEGESFDDVLVLTIRTPNGTREETVPFDSREFLSNSLAPALSFRNLEVGRKWRMRNFSMLDYTMQSAWAEVVGKEKLEIAGEIHDAFVVAIEQGKQNARVWIASDGVILKQQFMCFTFLWEPPSAEVLEALKNDRNAWPHQEFRHEEGR
jgi:hypothetical protein